MLRNDITIEPKNAAKKPVIIKPATNFATSKSMSAFITKVNSPRVSRLSGSVKIKNIGLINILTNPITTAANKAEVKPAKLIPGTIQAVNSNAPENSTHFINKLNILSLLFLLIYFMIKNQMFH